MVRIHTSEADGIEWLISHLKNYESITEHVPYNRHGLNSELDVLSERGRWLHYYEYKASWNKRTVAKAELQFRRVIAAMPEYNWRFVLVTPQGSREYHRDEL